MLWWQRKVHFDPFEDSELDDSILIRCSEQAEKSHFDNVVSDSEGEGDIPSLLTHVRKNIGLCIPMKPPICPPKKGFKVKSSKIKSVAGPSRSIQENDGNGEGDNTNISRFHKASEEEIESLQLDAKATHTHQQTKWGVKIIRHRSLGLVHSYSCVQLKSLTKLYEFFRIFRVYLS